MVDTWLLRNVKKTGLVGSAQEKMPDLGEEAGRVANLLIGS